MKDEITSSEAWRPVEGFEDVYAVSAYGEVYSFRLGRRLKQSLDRHGYPRVILKVGGKHQTRRVHRLVALAFHGDKRNVLHSEVDHIDHNRANNDASNLRWVSHCENLFRRAPWPGQKGERNGFSKLSDDAAKRIKRAHGKVAAAFLADQFGITIHTIYDIWRGRSWRHIP